MKTLLAMIMSVVCLNSVCLAAENWVKISKGEKNNVFIDKSSISKNALSVGAWFKIEKMTDSTPIDGKTPTSMKIFQECICSKNATRAKEIILFDKKKAIIGQAAKANADWQPVTQGSKNEIVCAALCGGTGNPHSK